MNNPTRYLSLVASASAAIVLAACGGGGGTGTQAGTGTLSVAMTDAPACGFDQVNVTVRKIRVHQSGSAGEGEGGWSEITLNPSRKINLLDLTNGVLEELGETSLPAGHYTQLRLVLDPNNGAGLANTVVLSTDPANTTEIPLDTPSAVQSGIKLVNGFEIADGETQKLVLDFDACKSIVAKGNGAYALKPVIQIVPTAPNGIDGFIDTALLDDEVMVTAQQNGVIVRSTVPDPKTGKFFLARMEPGNYDVVITAKGHATAVVAAVPVESATSTVALSTSGTPLTLQAAATAEPSRAISGSVTLPSNSTEVAYVAARQSFAAGPKVTVRYQGAAVSGAYTLANLPTIAPRLAKYSTTLPLSFAAQTDTTPGTGKYAVEASAAGVASKSVASVDVTAGDKTDVNFTLE